MVRCMPYKSAAKHTTTAGTLFAAQIKAILHLRRKKKTKRPIRPTFAEPPVTPDVENGEAETLHHLVNKHDGSY